MMDPGKVRRPHTRPDQKEKIDVGGFNWGRKQRRGKKNLVGAKSFGKSLDPRGGETAKKEEAWKEEKEREGHRVYSIK
jgi:hypothetical protein